MKTSDPSFLAPYVESDSEEESEDDSDELLLLREVLFIVGDFTDSVSSCSAEEELEESKTNSDDFLHFLDCGFAAVIF